MILAASAFAATASSSLPTTLAVLCAVIFARAGMFLISGR